MSRSAIDKAILQDSRLVALGFDEDSVLPNYVGDQRPNDKMFMTLLWGDEDNTIRFGDGTGRGFRPLTIWVHMYKKFSTNYARIDSVLNILDDIIMNMVHVEGEDGYTMTLAEKPAGNARSRDMSDRAYETICRSISYRILSRETESV